MDDHRLMQRLLAGVHEQMHGRSAGTFWYAPGGVALLADGVRSFAAPTQFGATVAVEPRADDVVDLRWVYRPLQLDRTRLSELGPCESSATAEAPCEPHAVIWALRAAGHDVSGAEITVHADVPRGVGLSISAAVACATAFALRDSYGLDLADDALIELLGDGLRAFGVPGVCPGALAASALARSGEAVSVARDGSARRVPFDVTAGGLRLLLVDPGIRGGSTGDQYTLQLRGWRALDPSNFWELGAVMTRTHEAECVAGLTSPEQDAVVTAAVAAGALGARKAIDGTGHPVVALVRTEDVTAVRRGICTAFALHGWRQPRFLTSAGIESARRAA